MKPAAFRYHVAATADEAVTLLSDLGDDARLLAGGQSLVPLMNFRLAVPEHVIDINPVRELAYVRRDDGQVAVGAVARQAAVERDPEVRRGVPLLAEALSWVGHPPIRHRGTVAGSIAHADPAAELPAVALALDATIGLRSANGARTVAASEFFLGPFETALRPGEMITEVSYPVAAPASGSAFVEFARRHGDFAIAGSAVVVTLDGDVVRSSRIVLCGVGPRPVRAGAAEDRLAGELPSEALIEAVSQLAVDGLEPSGDIHGTPEYRVRVARAQVRIALRLAVDRARGRVEVERQA